MEEREREICGGIARSKRGKKRDTERHTDRRRDRHTDRRRDRHTDRRRERERESERERERQTETKRDRKREVIGRSTGRQTLLLSFSYFDAIIHKITIK